MPSITHKDIVSTEAIQFAQFLQAYMECTAEVQEIIKEMCQIIVDKSSSGDEVEYASDVLIEALFPALARDLQDAERSNGNSSEARHADERLDAEEQSFADRLRDLMTERGITEAELATRTGVSQPAIANMLVSACRPQQRTISRFAEALGVPLEQLWQETE